MEEPPNIVGGTNRKCSVSEKKRDRMLQEGWTGRDKASDRELVDLRYKDDLILQK